MDIPYIEVSEPKLDTEDITMPLGCTPAYIPGRPEWQPITAKVSFDFATEVINQVQKQVNYFESVGVSNTNYKFDIKHGPWFIEGCWIAEYNIQHEEDACIIMTIQYSDVYIKQEKK